MYANKYKLVPVVSLSKDEAVVQAAQDKLFDILKNKKLDETTKRAMYEDLLKRVENYKLDHHMNQPRVVRSEMELSDPPPPPPPLPPTTLLKEGTTLERDYHLGLGRRERRREKPSFHLKV